MIYISAVGGYGVFAMLIAYFFKYKAVIGHHSGHSSNRDSTATGGIISGKKYQINYDDDDDSLVGSVKDPNRYLIASSE